MAHAGGRPTKYRPELCEDIIKFFDRPLYKTIVHRRWVDGTLRDVEETVPNDTPFLIDWVMKHDLCVDTPANWAKQFPEFFRAYNRAKSLQERFLVELGIKGDHNGFMTFQTLKNVAGWRDKHEVETRIESSNEIVIRLDKGELSGRLKNLDEYVLNN